MQTQGYGDAEATEETLNADFQVWASTESCWEPNINKGGKKEKELAPPHVSNSCHGRAKQTRICFSCGFDM